MTSELEVKVYYEDTDSLGVVYHANYLRYFERGRTEMINELGRGIHEWNAAGFNFAVVKMTINFHKPARLNDRCTVVTNVVSCGEFRMRLEQRLFRGEELLTDAKVELVCLDASLELRELPPEVLGLVGG